MLALLVALAALPYARAGASPEPPAHPPAPTDAAGAAPAAGPDAASAAPTADAASTASAAPTADAASTAGAAPTADAAGTAGAAPTADAAGTAPAADPDAARATTEAAPPSVDDRIDEAIELRQQGDLAGATALLVALEPLVPPERAPWYLYQRGICEELAFRPEDALPFYDRALALAGDAALDVRFRRSLVLEELGQYDLALADVRAIDRARGLSADDALTVALQRGITELASGRRRVGIARIERALTEADRGDSHRYLRAKARYHLAQALLDEADARPLRGGERRIVRNLERRALGMKSAEQQIVALAALREPEWVLASLVAFGDSHVRLADDLARSPAPRRLTPEQAAIYRAEVEKKAANVRAKALHAYDQGVALAARLAWESPVVATLRERRSALDARD